MIYCVYDPRPSANEYASFFFNSMAKYGAHTGRAVVFLSRLEEAHHCTLFILTDHLSEDKIWRLKNNDVHIAAFNVTDSSYFSNAIRYAPNIESIDRIFMLSGLPVRNQSTDFTIDQDFTIRTVPAPFLPEKEWSIYGRLLHAGKLASLPYVPWSNIPGTTWIPWRDRSKKVLLRGGGHSRRIVLAMFLMRLGKLDCNSAAILFPYFDDKMNPDFKFCEDCRRSYKALAGNHYWNSGHRVDDCNSPAYIKDGRWDFSNLGHWNNRCPRSFYWMAEQFNKRYGGVEVEPFETLLSGRWITDQQHQEMLSRIAFTSDLKWIHSVYTPQRFWQGASAGAINFLPGRTSDQILFPNLQPGQDYITFNENFQGLEQELDISEADYEQISRSAKEKYDHWIQPGQFNINTNLLDYIFNTA